jgi:hypothetical protein
MTDTGDGRRRAHAAACCYGRSADYAPGNTGDNVAPPMAVDALALASLLSHRLNRV